MICILRTILFVLLLCPFQFVWSQNAPGGVTVGLETWLRADIGVTGTTPVTAWANQKITGTAVLVNGSPNLNTVATTYNYNPYIDFIAPVGTLADGIAANRQCLRLSGYTGLAGLNYTSLFYSFHLTDLSRVNTHIAAVSGVTYGGPVNGTLHGSAVGANAAIMESGYDPTDFGSGSPASTWQRNGGNVAYNALHASIKHILSGSCMTGASTTVNTLLGGQQDNSSLSFVGHDRDWRGPVAEVIGYTSAISLIDRQKIHSYLGVKYGTTLSTNYLSTTGSTIFVTAAPYNLNIIGIGRDDAEVLTQKQSHNDDDLVRIYLNTLTGSNALNTGSFDSDISYVIIGANTDALIPTVASNAEVPASCGITARIAREWKVTRTNMSQTFSMDVKTATWNSCMRFLVDDDGNFGNGGTQCYYNGDGTGIVLSYAAGTITVANISSLHIPDNSTRFVTLGSPSTVSLFTFGNACINSSVQFTNQSLPVTATYAWDFGDGSAISTLLNPTHTYTAAGTYNVVLTVDNNGCISTSNQTITIYSLPIINAGLDVAVCQGGTITLSGSGGTTYVWDQAAVNNAAFVPLANSTYTVTGTDVNGCVSTDQIDVVVNALPIINAGLDATICGSGTVTLSGAGGVTYNWNLGVVDGIAFSPATTQIYTVTGTGANTCTNTDQVLVTVQASPIVNAGPDQLLCAGSNVALSGSGAITYAWDNGVLDGVSFIPALTQTYTVTGTDAVGCTATDQVTLTIDMAVVVQFTAPITNGCLPLVANLTNNSVVPVGSTCAWSFGDGSVDSNCGTVQHEYINPGCYDVSLTITTPQGCIWLASVADYICVFAVPVANFSPNPGAITDSDPTAQMVNSSNGAVAYSWDFGDGTTGTENDPIHTFPVSGSDVSYNVQLIATSNMGCSDTVTRTVKLTPLLLYYVPNSFTPDGDGLNQTFQPIFTAGYDPYDFEMTIYDRWGEIIFETKNDKVGWDGTFDGKIVQSGTYLWKIEFKTLVTDERKSINGHVNVLK